MTFSLRFVVFWNHFKKRTNKVPFCLTLVSYYNYTSIAFVRQLNSSFDV